METIGARCCNIFIKLLNYRVNQTNTKKNRSAIVIAHKSRSDPLRSIGSHRGLFNPFNGMTETYQTIPQKTGTKFVGAQKTEISISADGDFGQLKKTETPSKSRRVGRYASSYFTFLNFEGNIRITTFITIQYLKQFYLIPP